MKIYLVYISACESFPDVFELSIPVSIRQYTGIGVVLFLLLWFGTAAVFDSFTHQATASLSLRGTKFFSCLLFGKLS